MGAPSAARERGAHGAGRLPVYQAAIPAQAQPEAEPLRRGTMCVEPPKPGPPALKNAAYAHDEVLFARATAVECNRNRNRPGHLAAAQENALGEIESGWAGKQP